MTMDSNGAIKSFNIFKYKPVGMFEVNDIKHVKPLSRLQNEIYRNIDDATIL